MTKHKQLMADEGFFFGCGAFETIGINKEGQFLFLDEHLKRLENSLKLFRIPFEQSACLEALSKAAADMGAINTQSSYTAAALRLSVSQKNIWVDKRASNYSAENFRQGVRLDVGPYINNPYAISCGHKSLSFADNILAKRKAKHAGFDDALFLSPAGLIAETSCANIFLVKNDKLYTPKLSSGALPGVIRSFIIQNYPVICCDMRLEALCEAPEVFITNSVAGVLPVKQIGDTHFSECTWATRILNSLKTQSPTTRLV